MRESRGGGGDRGVRHPGKSQVICVGPEGGGRGPPPPGKSQVIWGSIGNKQVDPSMKKLDPPPPDLEKVEPPPEP